MPRYMYRAEPVVYIDAETPAGVRGLVLRAAIVTAAVATGYSVLHHLAALDTPGRVMSSVIGF